MRTTLKINTESKPYCGGEGDALLLAWHAEAAKDTDTPIELYASGHRKFMLECLGAPLAKDNENAVIPSGCYNLELDGRPRWEYLAQFLKVTTGIKRPPATIPQELLDWAYTQKAAANGAPFVALFPQTHWKPREWPQRASGPTISQQSDHMLLGGALGHIMAMMSVAEAEAA